MGKSKKSFSQYKTKTDLERFCCADCILQLKIQGLDLVQGYQQNVSSVVQFFLHHTRANTCKCISTVPVWTAEPTSDASKMNTVAQLSLPTAQKGGIIPLKWPNQIEPHLD